MPEGDYQVWRVFLTRRGHEWERYAYDVELHGGVAPIIDSDPALARQWARVIAKRVDAIGIRARGVTLFEVRHQAAWQSVGQLLGYRLLFPRDYGTVDIEAAVIVTDAIDAQIRAVAESHGLQVIIP